MTLILLFLSLYLLQTGVIRKGEYGVPACMNYSLQVGGTRLETIMCWWLSCCGSQFGFHCVGSWRGGEKPQSYSLYYHRVVQGLAPPSVQCWAVPGPTASHSCCCWRSPQPQAKYSARTRLMQAHGWGRQPVQCVELGEALSDPSVLPRHHTGGLTSEQIKPDLHCYRSSDSALESDC